MTFESTAANVVSIKLQDENKDKVQKIVLIALKLTLSLGTINQLGTVKTGP